MISRGTLTSIDLHQRIGNWPIYDLAWLCGTGGRIAANIAKLPELSTKASPLKMKEPVSVGNQRSAPSSRSVQLRRLCGAAYLPVLKRFEDGSVGFRYMTLHKF